MGYTKGRLIERAFSEMGLPSYVFELAPEQEQEALEQLDSMMAEWDARGIRLGYPLPSSPSDSELSTDTGLPDMAVRAVILNLAKEIAPSHGKTLSPQTLANADAAFRSVQAYAAVPQPVQWPSTLPLGAGNKPWRWWRNFAAEPSDSVATAPEVDAGFAKGVDQ